MSSNVSPNINTNHLQPCHSSDGQSPCRLGLTPVSFNVTADGTHNYHQRLKGTKVFTSRHEIYRSQYKMKHQVSMPNLRMGGALPALPHSPSHRERAQLYLTFVQWQAVYRSDGTQGQPKETLLCHDPSGFLLHSLTQFTRPCLPRPQTNKNRPVLNYYTLPFQCIPRLPPAAMVFKPWSAKPWGPRVTFRGPLTLWRRNYFF